MRNKGKLFALSILVAGAAVATASATAAWFQTSVLLEPDSSLTGRSKGAYFGGGDGSADHPYIITNKNHVYNLAWLYYLGYFDGQTPYFRVDADVAMEGLVLPPIGTDDHPFLGHFDGNGHSINGFTVTNKIASDYIELKPVTVTASNFDAPDILGFFGVVGNLSGDVATDSIKDLTLNNFTVKSANSGEALIGLAAGYVNGEISGIKVGGTTSIVANGNTAKTYTEHLSDYGLVGYTTTLGANGTYEQDLSEFYSAGGNNTTDPDWGDSIAFNKLNERLYNSLRTTDPMNMGIVTKKADTTGNVITSGGPMYRYYTKTDSKLTVYRGGSAAYTYFNSDPSTSSIIYNLMGQRASYGNTANPGTVLPLQVNDNYTVHAKNTGYITADSVDNSNGTVRAASYKVQHICGSLGDYSTSTYTIANLYSKTYSSIKYDASKFEVLTNTSATYSSGNYSLVKDSFNSSHTPSSGTFLYNYRTKTISEESLQRYTTARANLDRVLAGHDGTGASFVHGIHFYGASGDTSTRVTYSNPYTITARFNGADAIANYPLPRSCIDFKFKGNGYITIFAGSYYPAGSNTEADSFLNLFKVNRAADNSISGLTEIKKIYKNPNYDGTDDTVDAHIYSSDGNKPTGAGDQEFDVANYLSQIPVRNCVYYFEIPINAGEYAIGGCTGKVGGAYLMYLDIGANPTSINKDATTAYSITTRQTSNSFPAGVDFAPVTTGDAGGETIGVYIPASSTGTVSFDVTSSNIDIDDSSSITIYSFKGTKMAGTPPGSGYFDVTGDSPGALVTPPTGGERILLIHLTTTGDDEYDIRITDQLTNAAGAFDESDSVYEVDSGSGFVTSTKTAVEGLSGEINLNTLRALAIAAVLTRSTGTGQFETTYDTEHCSYADKTIDVDIERNGTTISIAVTTNYTFKIEGTQYYDNGTYPAP